MVYFSTIANAVAVACIASTAVAHPGEHHDHQAIKRQVRERDQFADAAKRSLDTCGDTLAARELNSRSLARRAAALAELRQRRNIKARTFISSLSHGFQSLTCLQLPKNITVILLLSRFTRRSTTT